jgi:hypothetical protein
MVSTVPIAWIKNGLKDDYTKYRPRKEKSEPFSEFYSGPIMFKRFMGLTIPVRQECRLLMGGKQAEALT